MRPYRLSFTEEEFFRLAEFYGFDDKATPDILRTYLASFKPGSAPRRLPTTEELERMTQDLMEAQSTLAALTVRCQEAEDRLSQLERTRGAIVRENEMLKQELEELRGKKEPRVLQ